jgi:UDP-N-acetylmuramate dehydrogenase
MIPSFVGNQWKTILMLLHKNISLKNFNTFKVDVSAKCLVVLETPEDILAFANSTEAVITPRIILGGGSNFLFTSDVDGIVIHSEIKGIEPVFESENEVWLKAGSGIVWDEFVKYTVDLNLGGLENLSNIPGCVGASPVQNIGAYGVEAKDSIVRVDAFNLESKTFETFTNEQCHFGYRDSIFKQPKYKNLIVTQVTFRLKKKPELIISYGTVAKEISKFSQPTVQHVRNAIIKIRTSKLPDENLGSAGSFFKNPVIGIEQFNKLSAQYPTIPNYKQTDDSIKIPAAWLIENSGLKGIRHGNVGTYLHQPLVIVNFGNATGKEIVNFSQFIQEKVLEIFGIKLEPEVCII